MCEVVAIDEGASSVPEKGILTLPTQPPPPSQESSQPPHHTSKKYTHRNARQQRQDNELYDVPEDLRIGICEKAMHRRFLERRQHLLELQIKRMEIRIAEAEERKKQESGKKLHKKNSKKVVSSKY